MEIIKSRYNNDRVIEKVSPTRLRIMGDSLIIRSSEDKDGNQTMFDFEGGPCLNVGGKIRFMKSNWTITSIIETESPHKDLASVIIEVKL